MEKTIRELCEEKWTEKGCLRPLYPCCWRLSYLGRFLIIKDNLITTGDGNAED